MCVCVGCVVCVWGVCMCGGVCVCECVHTRPCMWVSASMATCVSAAVCTGLLCEETSTPWCRSQRGRASGSSGQGWAPSVRQVTGPWSEPVVRGRKWGPLHPVLAFLRWGQPMRWEWRLWLHTYMCTRTPLCPALSRAPTVGWLHPCLVTWDPSCRPGPSPAWHCPLPPHPCPPDHSWPPAKIVGASGEP